MYGKLQFARAWFSLNFCLLPFSFLLFPLVPSSIAWITVGDKLKLVVHVRHFSMPELGFLFYFCLFPFYFFLV